LACKRCGGTDIEEKLEGPGRLLTFTFVHEPFGQGSLKPPYGVGLVQFEDGLTVKGLLHPQYHAPRLGEAVLTTEIELERDGEDLLLTYAFTSVP
jgi:uncharacterized OB-fold protein